MIIEFQWGGAGCMKWGGSIAIGTITITVNKARAWWDVGVGVGLGLAKII